MKVIGVIPSRFASVRFPGKPLAPIAGKPLLQWVIEGSQKSKLLQKVLVATDDNRIAELAKKCGAEYVMTAPELPSGTDRTWAALQDQDFDVAINIQGDEPLIQSHILDVLAQSMQDNPECEMGTLARHFESDEDLQSINTAKIILNHKSEAIYFSRLPIPYSRVLRNPQEKRIVHVQHIGIYAYRKKFLERLCQTPVQPMEIHEGLEQLRALYLGGKIKVTLVDYITQGVDTPDDVKKVEKILSKRSP